MEQATSQVQALKQMMESIKLITLSNANSLHFVSMPLDTSAPEEDLKFMFTRNYLAGFIIDKILYVKAECYKGGKMHNIFFENEFKIAREFFGLNDVVPLPLNDDEMEKLGTLIQLQKSSEKETETTRLINMLDDAKEIAEVLQSDRSTKLVNMISDRLKIVAEQSKSSEGETINKINENNQAMANSSDKEEVQKLFDENKKLLLTIEGTNETKKLSSYMDKIYSAKIKAPKSVKK